MSHLAWSLFNGVKYLQMMPRFSFITSVSNDLSLMASAFQCFCSCEEGKRVPILYNFANNFPPLWWIFMFKNVLKTHVGLLFFSWLFLFYFLKGSSQDHSWFKVDVQAWLWRSIIHMYYFVSSSQWKSQLVELVQCSRISMADVYSILKKNMRKGDPLGN